MSWLARSIANSLKLDDNNDDGGPHYDRSERENIVERETDNQHDQIDPSSSLEKGVKEDLSELTKTLSRQFWGVASFLAPPPLSEPSPPATIKVSDLAGEDEREVSDSAAIGGIRSDFAEIGGKFKSGISKLSSNIAVSEFTKIASNLLQLGSEEEGYGSVGDAVGVTEEVVAFVRDIVMHPETWLDFPLPDNEDDDEFDMSDAQQEHALAVERLAPRLAALRIELCPGYMSEDCFWKIYFVLLHPRLNKHDAELLSTPQIVKARALLTHELKNRTKAKPDQDRPESGIPNLKETSNSQHEETLSVPSNAQSESVPHEPSTIKSSASTISSDHETEKHPILSKEIQIIDKSIIEEEPVTKKNGQILNSSSSGVLEDKYEDDADDWLKEESSEIDGDGGSGTTIPIENEEDVSFSDLEDEDEDVPTNKKK